MRCFVVFPVSFAAAAAAAGEYSDPVTLTIGSAYGRVTCNAVLDPISLLWGRWTPMTFVPTSFYIKPYVKRTSGALDAAQYYPGTTASALTLVSQATVESAYSITLGCGAAFTPLVFVWSVCASAPCTSAAQAVTMGAAGVYSCVGTVTTDDTPSQGADLSSLSFSLAIAAAPVLTSVALNGASVSSIVRSQVTFLSSVASAAGFSSTLTCTDSAGGNAFLDPSYVVSFPPSTVASSTPSAAISVRLNSAAALGAVSCALAPLSGDGNFVQATVSLPAFTLVAAPVVSWAGLHSGGRYAVGTGPHRVQLNSTVAARSAVNFHFDCTAASWTPVPITIAAGQSTVSVDLSVGQFVVSSLGAATCTLSLDSTLDDNFAGVGAITFATSASFPITIVNTPTISVAATGDGLVGAWYPGQTLRQVSFVLSEAPTTPVSVLLVCSTFAAAWGGVSIFAAPSYSFVIGAGNTSSPSLNLPILANVGIQGPTECVYSTSAATTSEPNFPSQRSPSERRRC